MSLAKCSLYYSLDVAINGDIDSNWGGFGQFSTQMSNITSQLSSTASAITASFGSTNSLNSALVALKQQNLNIYNSNYQSTVFSPNHTTTNTSIQTNIDLPTITPLFISNGLGPSTQNNTMVYDIDLSFNSTTQVTNQALSVFSSAQLLSSSLANILSKYTSSLQTLTMNINYLTTAQASIDDFSTKVIDNAFSEVLFFIQGVLTLIMISSLLILLGVLATHYF